LCRHFQLRYAERFGLCDVPLPQALVESFCRRAWPGNVRELENRIAELLALSDDGVVSGPLLDSALASGPGLQQASPQPNALGLHGKQIRSSEAGSGLALREQVLAFERSLIQRALADADGNQSLAARNLGTTRTTLLDKLKRLGLT
jgi:two-component system response regulator AtoC